VRRRSTALREVIAIKSVLVVHLALFGVRKYVIRFLQLLEFFFGRFVAGIQIGMVFARKLAKRSANVLAAGLLRHPEQFVIIGFSCRCHDYIFVISNRISRNLSKSAAKKFGPLRL